MLLYLCLVMHRFGYPHTPFRADVEQLEIRCPKQLFKLAAAD
jgi:hypothetical protein